jgi:ABC-type antimicrobial peptide transport system permease subunit
MLIVQRIREKLVVGIIAILVGITVYTALGLAWSFKLAVEAPQRLWHYHR